MLLTYANYSPKGQLVWARNQETPPTRQEVDCFRYRQRLDVRKDNNDQILGGNTLLHSHFSLNHSERSTCYSEALRDIRDAITGASRVADAGFIVFSFEQDWLTEEPFDPEKIQIDISVSRNIAQLPRNKRDAIVDALEGEVREHIAAPILVQYPKKLRQLRPGVGHDWDEITKMQIDNEMIFGDSGKAFLKRNPTVLSFAPPTTPNSSPLPKIPITPTLFTPPRRQPTAGSLHPFSSFDETLRSMDTETTDPPSTESKANAESFLFAETPSLNTSKASTSKGATSPRPAARTSSKGAISPPQGNEPASRMTSKSASPIEPAASAEATGVATATEPARMPSIGSTSPPPSNELAARMTAKTASSPTPAEPEASTGNTRRVQSSNAQIESTLPSIYDTDAWVPMTFTPTLKTNSRREGHENTSGKKNAGSTLRKEQQTTTKRAGTSTKKSSIPAVQEDASQQSNRTKQEAPTDSGKRPQRHKDSGSSLSTKNKSERNTPAQPYSFEEPDDPPPSYYETENVDVFEFPRPVRFFLEAHRISVNQCARIMEGLRYHYGDWLYAFKMAGLEASVAHELKTLLLQTLPSNTLEIYHIAGDLPEDETHTSSSAMGNNNTEDASSVTTDDMVNEFDSLNVGSDSDNELEYV